MIARDEYENLLDNLASGNIPVEQTKAKLMALFDKESMGRDLIGTMCRYDGRLCTIVGITENKFGVFYSIKRPGGIPFSVKKADVVLLGNAKRKNNVVR